MIADITSTMRLLITETVNELKARGYQLMLRRGATFLYFFEGQRRIIPEHFNVDESYYFEETETPDVDRMLYAISLSDGRKGFLIDTCTIYMDNISLEIMQKLQLNTIINWHRLINSGEIMQAAKVIE